MGCEREERRLADEESLLGESCPRSLGRPRLANIQTVGLAKVERHQRTSVSMSELHFAS